MTKLIKGNVKNVIDVNRYNLLYRDITNKEVLKKTINLKSKKDIEKYFKEI